MISFICLIVSCSALTIQQTELWKKAPWGWISKFMNGSVRPGSIKAGLGYVLCKLDRNVPESSCPDFSYNRYIACSGPLSGNQINP